MKVVATFTTICVALGTAAMAGEWADTVTIVPPAYSKPLPVTGKADIQYPCGWFDQCDMVDFMERNQVCALLVMQHGETVLHWVAPSRRGCTVRVVNQRYGVASITKSITSILLGRLMQHRDIDVATTVADALRPAGVAYPHPDITLRDLLHMSSGMLWSGDEQPAIRIEKRVPGEPRTLKEAVQDRLKDARFRPDRYGRAPFNYSGFDTQLLGTVAEALLPEGVTLAKFLEVYLWPKIGAGWVAEWKTDFEKQPAAYCCLYPGSPRTPAAEVAAPSRLHAEGVRPSASRRGRDGCGRPTPDL